jgi:tetratricopeptide (TPR) repeat protein
MQTIRIFISSPGDVAKERALAREVVESLRRRYARHFMLQAVLWENLPLQSDQSFQAGIDAVLSEKGANIAIFILWSRLGLPLGPTIVKPDGTPYRSGTEREYDLIIRARAKALHEEGRARPDILVYTRRDDPSFEESLRGTSTGKKDELIQQKKLVESFLAETFLDPTTGIKLGAYYPFDRPAAFAQLLRAHLQHLLDQLAGETMDVIWDADKLGPPFLGLESFQARHAAVFFGREEETLEARHALKEQARNGCAFLLLLGGSGSGKSSLARAGVLPAIVELELDEQVAGWRSLVITPAQLGPDPIATLVDHLAADDLLPGLRQHATSLPDLVAGLKKDPELTFSLRLKEVLVQTSAQHGGAVRLLLVLDQLEELFTTPDLAAEDRTRFLAVIETFARSGCVWVLATARSDFYQQILSEPALVRMKAGHGQFDVLPPGPDALARLIEEPARMAGLTFEMRDEQALSSRILKDAASHAELLPLVEFVLRELYEHRTENRQLTFATYEALGGVEGALAMRADQTCAALPGNSRESLASVLQALVTLGSDAGAADEKIVRQRAPLADFASLPAARALIDAFIVARLFTTCQIEGTGEPGVTVAHESLLRVWPRAKEWADNNRAFLHARARIAARMAEDSPLLAGDRLLEIAKVHFRANRDGFTVAQRQWIEDAIVAAEAKERRAARLRRCVWTALSVLTLLALLAAAWAFKRERDAKREQAKSERSLQMIGDAHASASKMVADVLVDLRSKLEPGGQAGPLADAQRIVNEHFDENELPGNDDDSLHMRSVVLNSRGYLARSMGDFATAQSYYMKALAIREALLSRDRDKAMYQHNLALSYDSLGDLHAAMAQTLRNSGKQSKEEFDSAIAEYRKGLDLAKGLVLRSDATSQWRHDLAVSYFKVGDALFESGSPEDALAVLLVGFPIAEKVAASDPSYAKWQAHLGLYCLELGRLNALSAKTDAARAFLQRGKNIFAGLRQQGHQSIEYIAWQKRIEQFLLDLE